MKKPPVKLSNKDARQYLKTGMLPDTQMVKRKGNKYNARRIKADDPANPYGVDFDSKLELRMYAALKASGLSFSFHNEWVIFPAIQTQYKKFSARKFTPDFVFEELGIIMDTKSDPTTSTVFRMRCQMLMQVLADEQKDLGKLDEPLPVIMAVKEGQLTEFIHLCKAHGHHINWPKKDIKKFIV